MDGFDALSTAGAGFERRLRLVRPDDWERPTPCAEWDVRALVNHVVGGNRRYTMLLNGASAVEVEAARSADHLGDDPLASFRATGVEVTAAFGQEGALDRTVHHRVGDRTGAELLAMRVLDVAVHSWDLACAIDADDTLDADVVEFLLTVVPALEASRQLGAFAAPLGEPPVGGSSQDRLLHLLGRQPRPTKGDGMTDLDAFLESTLPRLKAAETALHNGDASQRIAMWSRNDPVTLFGAAFSGSGWAGVGPTFDFLASRFSNCTSSEFELMAAGVSGDLAYIVGIEHTTASVAGAPPTPYSLRSTTIFRREDGEWKAVHRHGDPYDATAGELASRMRESGTP